MPCGPRAWETETDFHSGPGGRWQLDVYPPITTAYRVRWNGHTSRTLTVRVRPSVVLRADGRGRFVVSITAATRLSTDASGLLERLEPRPLRAREDDPRRRRRPSRADRADGQPTFARRSHAAASLRAVFPKSACYLAGFSNTLRL
jgi:hypothetical protein